MEHGSLGREGGETERERRARVRVCACDQIDTGGRFCWWIRPEILECQSEGPSWLMRWGSSQVGRRIRQLRLPERTASMKRM